MYLCAEKNPPVSTDRGEGHDNNVPNKCRKIIDRKLAINIILPFKKSFIIINPYF